MRPATGATILHADLDAFYASVEQLLDPTLRNRPIAVGGGVVLAASYEAKRLGVHGGMPAWRAKALCPSIKFVGGHFGEYRRLGDAVVSLFHSYTPLVERISIDEAFLDVAGAVHLFGRPATIATTIRERVREEIGLPLSIGVARTKHLAKVASQVAKPDGLVVVEPGRERAFLSPLPVELIWGVGPATSSRLHQSGIRTIGELAAADPAVLERLVGTANGAKLASLSTNDDPRRVESPREAKSMGAQAALGRRTVTPELIRETLGYLADRVGGRLRQARRAGRTITVKVRFTQLRSVTRAVTLSEPISETLGLTEVATDLAHQVMAEHPGEREITLLALSVSKLRAQESLQPTLWSSSPTPAPIGSASNGAASAGPARWGVDKSVDAIREKFGRSAIGYASLVFSESRWVPEEFRELAEH